MGAEHLSADIASTEEGGRMMLDKEPKVFINHQKAEIWKKLQSQKISLPLFGIVGTALIIIIIVLGCVLINRGVPRDSPTSAPQPCAADWCTGDWILNRAKCYYFSTEQLTWTASRDFCLQNNSTLAIINNDQDLKFLERFKDLRNLWIGLQRTKSGWSWVNGASYNKDIFPIIRPATHEDSEYVYLNDKGVKSGPNQYVKKWICMK